jgi:hypothetical protein
VKCHLTERLIAEFEPGNPNSGTRLRFGGGYCYCGDFLKDVSPLPKGYVHEAAAWQLVAGRLCPTFQGEIGSGGCCCGRRRCLSDRVLKAVIYTPAGGVRLRDLARLLDLFRQRLPLDLLAMRGSAVAKAASRTMRTGNRKDVAIKAEFNDLDAAEKRLRSIPARAAEPAKPTTTILPAETGDYGRPSREVVGPFPEDMR